MAWQLIYTSALRTLVPGQTGYGTVARSADLREALIQRLEQLSYYQHLAGSAAGATSPSHVVSAYRILDFRGSRYHILTRIQDAGLDFTSRTNHIAHHLIFEPAELAGLPPPAVILAQWNGWRSRWDEGPRLLDEADWGDLRALPRGVALPALAWQELTGDAGSAAALLARPLVAGCNLVCSPGDEATLLNLFAESLQLLDADGRHPVKSWEHTFTTFLQAEDSAGDFRWRGCIEGTPGWQAVQRNADGSLVSLRSITAPATPLAKLAREGRSQVSLPNRPALGQPLPAPTGTPTSLRLERNKPEWRPSSPVASPPKAAATPPPRTITLNLGSPRFLIPVALLCLVGLLAFVWPGFLRTRGGDTLPEKKLPPSLASGETGFLLPDAPPGRVASDNPLRTTDNEVASPPPRGALEELTKKIDGTATWIVLLERDSALTFPPSDELNSLLKSHLLGEEKPLSEIVKNRVASVRIELAGEPGAALELVTHREPPKKIKALFAGGAQLVLDCDDWYKANKDTPVVGVPVKLRWDGSAVPGALTVLLLPAPNSPMTAPLRLIVLSGNATSSAALTLDLAFLRPGRSDLTALPPDLQARVKAIRVSDDKAQWQFRPSTATSADMDLIESLAPAFSDEMRGRELDLAALREHIAERLAEERAREANVLPAVEKLQRLVQEDRPVGETVMGLTDELASFASYIKVGRQRRFDRQAYVEYLRAVFAGLGTNVTVHLPPADAPDSAAQHAFTQLHAALARKDHRDKVRKTPPADSFLASWESLGQAGELQSKASELQLAQNGIARFEKYLNLVPPSLAATPRVSLVLQSGGRRFEVIRFTNPASPSAKATPP